MVDNDNVSYSKHFIAQFPLWSRLEQDLALKLLRGKVCQSTHLKFTVGISDRTDFGNSSDFVPKTMRWALLLSYSRGSEFIKKFVFNEPSTCTLKWKGGFSNADGLVQTRFFSPLSYLNPNPNPNPNPDLSSSPWRIIQLPPSFLRGTMFANSSNSQKFAKKPSPLFDKCSSSTITPP